MARARRKSYAEIQGLEEFAKSLGIGLQRWPQLEEAFLGIATQTIVERAKSQARTLGRLEASSAEDIRAAGAGTVVYGGHAKDFGAEFGAYQYKQFETWRGRGDDAGYFLWPTIREFRDEEFMDEYARTVLSALDKAFSR